MDGHGIHEPGEEEAVAAHLRAGVLEVVRDLLGRADDAVPGAAAAGLEELAQCGAPRPGLGEVVEGALVAVGVQFRQRSVEVELFEVDH
ncbi:hypothetical protein D3C85_1684850 [compost metagenome]